MLHLLSLTCGLFLAVGANAQVNLASAASFGVLAATTITNTGLSVIVGQIGVSPGTAITGFPPGISGPVHSADAVAATAQTDAKAAYAAAAALTPTTDLTGQDLGGKTLGPGVYHFSSSAGLTGTLTLDGLNKPNSLFVFQIGSTLTTATASSVILINGAQACNVFWQVGSSATVGTSTNFVGNILALASITGNSAVTVKGGLYALTAAVTLIDDQITNQASCIGVVPTTTTSGGPTPTTCSAGATKTVTATCTPVTKTVTVSQRTATTFATSECTTKTKKTHVDAETTGECTTKTKKTHVDAETTRANPHGGPYRV